LLISDNRVFAWGRNDEYQLGLPFANWTKSSTGLNGVAPARVSVQLDPEIPVGSFVAGSSWALVAVGSAEPKPRDPYYGVLPPMSESHNSNAPVEDSSSGSSGGGALIIVLIALLALCLVGFVAYRTVQSRRKVDIVE
jgi:hypothetical protein